MSDDFYEPLKTFRSYLMLMKDAKGVDACNTIMDRLDKSPRVFVLSEKDAEDLFKFLMDIGYISREFHDSIHEIGNNLAEFIKENKKDAISSSNRKDNRNED